MISDEDPSLDEDIRRTDWMVEKIINNDVYAQHLYAALCNNVFIKNESWFILKNAEWSCSWRYRKWRLSRLVLFWNFKS